ncbi:MAG: hypothetical protein HC888_00400 [Candidatus Competibacteraceae bacterium]|nr:hypothetical protein [Candidatus Competibacteraceae bacterium]
MSETKKTSCRKRIARTIQTKQYETLNISIESEDEIEWTSIKDRDDKLAKLTNLAIRDFEETFNQVCEAFGFDEKRVFVKQNGAVTPRDPRQVATSNAEDDGLGAFDTLG